MYACYKCGGEITFRRRLRTEPERPRDLVRIPKEEEEWQIYPIHVDGRCEPEPIRYVPVSHGTVIPFLGPLVGRNVVGLVLNVADRRVVLIKTETSLGQRVLYCCDLRISEDEVARVYIGAGRKPSRQSTIAICPIEVAVRPQVGPDERALYAETFELVPISDTGGG